MTYQEVIIPNADLVSDFNIEATNEAFKVMTAQERIVCALRVFGSNSVLSSSFGPQSLLMLHYVTELSAAISVVTVDIDDSKYDEQRSYRDKLRNSMGLHLQIAYAQADDRKVQAMDSKLNEVGARAVFSGIRASQTENRAGKQFVELNKRNGLIDLHPLLDWSDAKAAHYLKQLPEELQHPKAGQQAIGGVILDAGIQKVECGLHI